MSSPRTAGRLLRCYPPAWRERYGEELAALVVDMSDGRVSWRARLDVVAAAGRERLRALGLLGDGSPHAEARAGASLVAWAWALFVFAGGIVQTTSEHWQAALPGGHALASSAFDVLVGVAIMVSALGLVGVAVAGPALARWVRAGGGWSRIARRVRVACAVSGGFVAATAGVVVWARQLSGHQRAGADLAYALGFSAWALLGLAVLLSWAAAASAAERELPLPARTVRMQVRLAALMAGGMAVMTTATVLWWVAVADRAPAALTGSVGGHLSPAVPQLILAAGLMLAASALGAIGARRAWGRLPALDAGQVP